MADFRTRIVISAEAAQALAQLSRVAGQFNALGRDGTRAGAELASGFSVARRGVASISEQLAQLRRDAIRLFSLRLGFNLGRDIFNAAAGFESLEKGLEAVLGSSEAARQALAFVRAESARLGIGLEVAAQQFTQMAAAARGTALEGEPVRRLFSATAQTARPPRVVATHTPPNGWNCRCALIQLSERDLLKLGKSGPDDPPPSPMREWTNPRTGEVLEVPVGVDPGWGYAPGRL